MRTALRRGGVALPAALAITTLAAVLAGPAATSVTARPTAARTVPTSGHLTTCYGRTIKVDDGDTVEVRLTSGCFSNRRGTRMIVRNAGIQATEHGRPGECWWKDATRNFDRLMRHGSHVRLQSYKPTRADDSRGKVRYLKYMDVAQRRNGKTHWVDVQLSQLERGLVMWKPQEKESAHNAAYRLAMADAMAAHLGMWGDPTHCSSSYAPHANVFVWIGWKTDGADSRARAGQEWVRVLNRGSGTVNLSHWLVRDASHSFYEQRKTYFTFPSGTKVAPGQYLTIYPTHGAQDAESLHFHDNAPANRLPYWRNVHLPGRAAGSHYVSTATTPLGGEVFLLDPAKDFRAWAVYPCVVHCSDPSLRITHVTYSGPDEKVVVTNVSGTVQDATGVVLDANGMRKEFKPGTLLEPGQSVTVYCDRSGTDTATQLYWKHPGKTSMLSDHGGTLWLRTYDDVTIDMASWSGGGSYKY